VKIYKAVWIDEKIKEALRKKAFDEKKSVCEVVEKLIEKYLNDKKESKS